MNGSTSITLTISATTTHYGRIRVCWIKRRGYARIPDRLVMGR